MNKILLFISFLLLPALASATGTFNLPLTIYKNDTVKFGVSNATSCEPTPFRSVIGDNYTLRIISSNGTLLYEDNFKIDFNAYRFRGPNSTEPDVVPLDKVEGCWQLPFFKDSSAVLYHENISIYQHYLLDTPADAGGNPCSIPAAVLLVVLVGMVKYW